MSTAASYLARWAAQKERVRLLYRRALKDTLNWAVHRHLFYRDASDLREKFEANKHVEDLDTIDRLIEEAEATYAKFQHPDPYIVPWAPGGTKFTRNPPPPPGGPNYTTLDQFIETQQSQVSQSTQSQITQLAQSQQSQQVRSHTHRPVSSGYMQIQTKNAAPTTQAHTSGRVVRWMPSPSSAQSQAQSTIGVAAPSTQAPQVQSAAPPARFKAPSTRATAPPTAPPARFQATAPQVQSAAPPARFKALSIRWMSSPSSTQSQAQSTICAAAQSTFQDSIQSQSQAGGSAVTFGPKLRK